MKTAAAVLLALCAVAFGEDAPATMTKLMVKFESPEVPKDSFAGQPKRMYRAASGYCRVEENPDLEHGIHGLMIINEPDIWMINRLDKTAQHIVDPTPPYNCRIPIFVTGDEIHSAEDVRKPLMELEFGRELEYFRSMSAAAAPGPVMRGKATTAYVVRAGGSLLVLFTTGDPEAPVAVVRNHDNTHETFWYGEYAQVPFDPQLFAKPEGVKIEEPKR